jgi:hypothetical protein
MSIVPDRGLLEDLERLRVSLRRCYVLPQSSPSKLSSAPNLYIPPIDVLIHSSQCRKTPTIAVLEHEMCCVTSTPHADDTASKKRTSTQQYSSSSSKTKHNNNSASSSSSIPAKPKTKRPQSAFSYLNITAPPGVDMSTFGSFADNRSGQKKTKEAQSFSNVYPFKPLKSQKAKKIKHKRPSTGRMAVRTASKTSRGKRVSSKQSKEASASSRPTAMQIYSNNKTKAQPSLASNAQSSSSPTPTAQQQQQQQQQAPAHLSSFSKRGNARPQRVPSSVSFRRRRLSSSGLEDVSSSAVTSVHEDVVLQAYDFLGGELHSDSEYLFAGDLSVVPPVESADEQPAPSPVVQIVLEQPASTSTMSNIPSSAVTNAHAVLRPRGRKNSVPSIVTTVFSPVAAQSTRAFDFTALSETETNPIAITPRVMGNVVGKEGGATPNGDPADMSSSRSSERYYLHSQEDDIIFRLQPRATPMARHAYDDLLVKHPPSAAAAAEVGFMSPPRTGAAPASFMQSPAFAEQENLYALADHNVRVDGGLFSPPPKFNANLDWRANVM